MKYRTILMDADGTLLDFARSEHEALADTLTQFDLPTNEIIHKGYSEANAEQWLLLEKKQVTRSELRVNRFRNFCAKFGFERDPSAMADFYENSLAQKSFLLDDAEKICKILSQACDLYIVTNGFRRIQNGRFNTSPLPVYFRDCFISEEIGVEKPDPRFFERVAEHIPGFNKKTTLIVGDSLSSDIAGGISFGIDTCWFNPTQKEAPLSVCPTYTISELSQLQSIILGGI